MAQRFQLGQVLSGTLAERYPELSGKQVAFAASVAARAEQYGGIGRTEFFKGQEYGAGDGYIVEYEAVDDKGTCSGCLAAEEAGPYLPGEGAFPGAACFGRGRCRCRRVVRYDPAKAAELRGENVG